MLDVNIQRKVYESATGERVEALGPLAFHVAAGEVVALMGPSGCGKSTLMRLISGLDNDFEGRIARPRDLAIGMVFQEPTLLPWRTVEKNVQLVMRKRADDDDFMRGVLARMELTEHSRKFPGELSVGLARRVAIARALAVRPQLLILDEPFASLDTPLVSRLQTHLGREIALHSITTLLVTHRLDDALPLVSRLLVFDARPGRILADLKVPKQDNRGDFKTLRMQVEQLLGGDGTASLSARQISP